MERSQETNLTERQIEVLELREQGLTQADVAAELGTSGSNVSAIERAAETNIEKARTTLEVVHTIRSAVTFDVEAGEPIDTIVETIYARGDAANIRISYRKPELYGHLYHELEPAMENGQLQCPVTVGITAEGRITAVPRSSRTPKPR